MEPEPIQEIEETTATAMAEVNTAMKNMCKSMGHMLEQSLPGFSSVIDPVVNDQAIPDPKETGKNMLKTLTGLATRSASEEQKQDVEEAVDNVFDSSGSKNFTNNICDLLGKLMGEQDNRKMELMKLLMHFQCKTAEDEYTSEDVNDLRTLANAIREGTFTMEFKVFSPQMQEEFKEIMTECFANMFSRIAQAIQDKLDD